MRINAAFDRQDYRVLLHLQGEATPYEGGELYSTGDVPLCELAYAPQAQDNVTIVQHLFLPIPSDLEAGEYHLAMGFYEPNNFTRLSVIPVENEYHYTEAWYFQVTE
jgi:hypothetical protein